MISDLPDLWWFMMLLTNGQIPVEKIQETWWKQLHPSVDFKTYIHSWDNLKLNIFIHRAGILRYSTSNTLNHISTLPSSFFCLNVSYIFRVTALSASTASLLKAISTVPQVHPQWKQNISLYHEIFSVSGFY